MKSSLVFSIVIPVYNVEKYIDECIISIINQTFTDYEIILVDDGSTDKSGEKCDEYLKKYSSKINVIHQNNEGQFSARHTGIKVSNGDYIISVDADDYLRQDALEILYSNIQKSNADIIMFNGSRDISFSEPFYNYEFEDECLFIKNDKKVLYKKLLSDNSLNSFCMKVYKRKLFQNSIFNIEKIKSIRNGEDMMQLLPIITKAASILFINEKLYYYRPNPTSVTRQYNSSFYESRKIIFEELEKYIDIWEIPRNQGMSLLTTKTLDNIYYVIKDLKYIDDKTIHKELVKISNDPWFNYIYENANKNSLRFKERFVLKLLKYRLIFMLFLCIKLS